MDDIRRFERENTVSARNQLSGAVYRSEENTRPRILFVGNSITLHEVKPDIGWHWRWGMAASDIEKDYVHQTMRMVREIIPGAGFGIAQNASWERAYWMGEEAMEPVREMADWDPDIVVIRIGENIREEDLAEHDLTDAFGKMMDYFNRSGRAKFIVTDLFWPNPVKEAAIMAAAREKGASLVSISHLGTQDEMKAIGLFEHAGVAAHPGDLGMLKIAEAIFEAMKPMLEAMKS